MYQMYQHINLVILDQPWVSNAFKLWFQHFSYQQRLYSTQQGNLHRSDRKAAPCIGAEVVLLLWTFLCVSSFSPFLCVHFLVSASPVKVTQEKKHKNDWMQKCIQKKTRIPRQSCQNWPKSWPSFAPSKSWPKIWCLSSNNKRTKGPTSSTSAWALAFRKRPARSPQPVQRGPPAWFQFRMI